MIGRIAKLLGFKPTDPANKPPGFLFVSGPTVPSDGASGYAIGCLFQHTDGANGTSVYVNEGTLASADFNAVTVAGALEITTAMLAALSVTTAKIAAGEVTGAKLSKTGLASGGFTGSDGAGACTLTGATVGQRVLAVMETTATVAVGVAEALFESTITVADQIQQSSVANNSAKRYVVLLAAVAA